MKRDRLDWEQRVEQQALRDDAVARQKAEDYIKRFNLPSDTRVVIEETYSYGPLYGRAEKESGGAFKRWFKGH